jgi:hypothetical protein
VTSKTDDRIDRMRDMGDLDIMVPTYVRDWSRSEEEDRLLIDTYVKTHPPDFVDYKDEWRPPIQDGWNSVWRNGRLETRPNYVSVKLAWKMERWVLPDGRTIGRKTPA